MRTSIPTASRRPSATPPTDVEIGSWFSGLNPVYPGECPGGAAGVRGSADFTGNVTTIPESGSCALMLAGLA